MQTLTLSQPKTINWSSPNLKKVIMSWMPITKKNLGLISLKVFAPHIGEIYTFPVRNLLHFFWFLNSPTGESVRPIFTLNTSNDAVLRKKVFF